VEGRPMLPDGTLADEIFSWIESLSSHTPPTWIGLDNKAEAVREQKIADSVERKVGIVGALMVMDGV
jgi:dynein heavy chain 1, cytosolic